MVRTSVNKNNEAKFLYLFKTLFDLRKDFLNRKYLYLNVPLALNKQVGSVYRDYPHDAIKETYIDEWN